jgi:hypothetical protein
MTALLFFTCRRDVIGGALITFRGGVIANDVI